MFGSEPSRTDLCHRRIHLGVNPQVEPGLLVLQEQSRPAGHRQNLRTFQNLPLGSHTQRKARLRSELSDTPKYNLGLQEASSCGKNWRKNCHRPEVKVQPPARDIMGWFRSGSRVEWPSQRTDLNAAQNLFSDLLCCTKKTPLK